MTVCGRCGFKWGGSRTEHCMGVGCHQTFTSTTAGDMHRTGHHGVTEGEHRRRCLTEAEMLERGMARNAAGIWTTGVHMPAGWFAALGQEPGNAAV